MQANSPQASLRKTAMRVESLGECDMRLGWPVGSTDDEGILAWMIACRKQSLAFRYKPPR